MPESSTNGSEPAAEERLRLGGMALRNGLLIHGPTSWAVAARNSAGEIEVASGPKPTLARGRLATTPVVRGPLRLIEALAVVPLARMRLRSARLPFEDPAVAATLVGSTLVTRVLRSMREATAGREAVIALLGSLPALAALRDHDLAAYHGVEHKSIGGYETDTDPNDVAKEHERCGSNLIGPMMGLSIGGQVLLEHFVDEPGPVARAATAMAAAGVAVELFAYAEKHPDSPIGRGIHGPGHEIQRLFSTREPTPEQMEVGEAALREVLRAEGVPADTV
jgi:uncharacterized protein YqhQ